MLKKKEEAASFDFYSPAFREAYFEDVHHPLEDQGWTFGGLIGKGSHGKMDPLWLLNHYHYLDNCRKGQAGLILSRYGVLAAIGIRSVFRGHYCNLGNP